MAGSIGRWAAVPVSTQLDPRVLQLSVDAELFYSRAWLYVGEHCTDGVIPPSALPILSMKLSTPAGDLLDELRKHELVKRNKRDDDILAGYLDVNPSAAQVKRRADHGRKAAIARWAKEKPPAQSDESGEDPGAKSDTEYASGNASGMDEQCDEHADGNAPHGTGRDVTDISLVVGGDISNSSGTNVDDDDEHSPNAYEPREQSRPPSWTRDQREVGYEDGPEPLASGLSWWIDRDPSR